MKVQNIIEISKLESTNDYVSLLIKNNNIKSGTVVIADNQTLGRGQRNAIWYSEPYKNLTFSIYIQHDKLSIDKIFYVNKVVCISILDFLKKNDICAKIKWPNDLYINKNKISGVLIENNIKSQFVDSSIIGVGINVNQSNFKIENVTSFYNEKNIIYNLKDLLKIFLECFEINFNKLSSLNFDILNNEYLENLYKFNIWSTYKDKNGIFEGKIVNVDEYGRLIIENRKGEILSFLNKEIAFIH